MTPAFTFHCLRFHYAASVPLNANLVRGAFGSALKSISEAAYQRYFTPHSANGPSGLKDLPRPFVFRLREPEVIGLNVFAPEAIDIFSHAVLSIQRIEIIKRHEPQLIRVPLSSAAAEKIRVHFLTPTELKPADEPHFGVLLSRIRDRVHTLNSLWGDGDLTLDFKEFGERASLIKMTRCDLRHVHEQRLSRSTGQAHSLGGFTGVAEYAGNLTEFIPYLEIARHTGVGRQTVWGKGEISYETF